MGGSHAGWDCRRTWNKTTKLTMVPKGLNERAARLKRAKRLKRPRTESGD
jgi:hypothetical protein